MIYYISDNLNIRQLPEDVEVLYRVQIRTDKNKECTMIEICELDDGSGRLVRNIDEEWRCHLALADNKFLVGITDQEFSELLESKYNEITIKGDRHHEIYFQF